MTKIICIVEPLHSANYLAKRLKQENYVTIALRVNNNGGMSGEFNIDLIRDSVDYGLWDILIDFDIQHGKLRTLLDELELLKVKYLFYGCEYIIEFADILSQELGLSHNDYYTANQRFDKFAMQTALAKCNLNIPRQALITPYILPDMLENLINRVGFPLVLKPRNSFSSMETYFIHDIQEFSKFSITKHLELHLEFICQEQIYGTEYFVDTFSFNGLHQVSVVGMYKKEVLESNLLYHSINYVQVSTVMHHELCNYTKQVLNAVGMVNGFAHSEIFVTRENHKYLIKVNPHIANAAKSINCLAKVYDGVDQIDLLNKVLGD